MALMCKAKENISLWNVICVYIKMPGSISINLKQEIINRISNIFKSKVWAQTIN